MKKEEYAHLKGREVYYKEKSLEQTGVVLHIDFEYGITITDKEDHNDRLLCLTHPAVYRLKRGRPIDDECYKRTLVRYEKRFKEICLALEKGTPFDENFTADAVGSAMPPEVCAFSL